MASFAANPAIGTAFTIGGTAGSKITQLDENNPSMSEGSKVMNALTTGTLEYATEKIFGSIPILNRAIGLKTKEGKALFQNVVTETWTKYAKKLGHCSRCN